MKIKDNYLLFWKTKDYMSNWHESHFEINGITFNCAEQYMMYSKAMMFNDTLVAQEVLKTTVPRDQKALGRKVSNFDNKVWEEQRFDILYEGCLAKFEQNEKLKELLLSTDDLHLVEASPYDEIWGIGLGEDHQDATNPEKWRGLNLLGEVLMKVRSTLRNS